uniref:Sugar transporter n=1 Tax=Rhizophora mucronata TaxID=61149 RepID=A0A2P2KXD3_RHIMU
MLPSRDAIPRVPCPVTGLATQLRPSGPYNFIWSLSSDMSSSPMMSSAGPIMYSSSDVSPPIPSPSTSRAISPETSTLPRSLCKTSLASSIRPLLTSHLGDSGKKNIVRAK